MDYTKVLIDLIKDEIDGEDYNYSKQDGLVFEVYPLSRTTLIIRGVH